MAMSDVGYINIWVAKIPHIRWNRSWRSPPPSCCNRETRSHCIIVPGNHGHQTRPWTRITKFLSSVMVSVKSTTQTRKKYIYCRYRIINVVCLFGLVLIDHTNTWKHTSIIDGRRPSCRERCSRSKPQQIFQPFWCRALLVDVMEKACMGRKSQLWSLTTR